MPDLTPDELALECGGALDHEGEEDDAVTVLVCAEGKRATKKWRAGATTADGYDAGTLFEHRVYPVADLHELATLLDGLASNARAFVVRGEPLEGIAPIGR